MGAEVGVAERLSKAGKRERGREDSTARMRHICKCRELIAAAHDGQSTDEPNPTKWQPTILERVVTVASIDTVLVLISHQGDQFGRIALHDSMYVWPRLGRIRIVERWT